MAKDEDEQYKTTAEDEHWRDEEFQWVRIIKAGPVRGMVLLYIQKMCTAFHEFEPAWKAEAVKGELLDFFCRRLGMRVRQVLVTMKNNGLDNIDGAAQLAEILESVESAKSGDDLAELSEKVHAVNHVLLDSLEIG